MSKGKMGFWTIVLFGINSIIGSGIFLLPNNAMSIIGPASLGVLLFDMLLVLAMTFCFAEASGVKHAVNEKHYCNRNFCTAGNYEPVWRAAV